VAEVEANTINLIVVNPTWSPVEIPADTQLAGYELLSSDSQESTVNRVVELEGFDETVAVGEELNDDLLRELSKILVENKEAFSRGGQIGELKNPKFFHKIELIPDTRPFNEPLRRRPQVHIEEIRKQVKKC